jgi:AraC-like DNA-binding protein
MVGSLRAQIVSLRPYPTLALFAVPLIVLEPVKPVAAYLAGTATLRAACEEHLGMGPIRYLALRRMHLVRRAQLRAVSSTTTVTRIAADRGFWELGRFATNYHSLFGEKPSVTLRRPAERTAINLNRPSTVAGRQPFGLGELASLRP